MKENITSWAVPEALEWLQIVLAERFGQELVLRVANEKTLVLALPQNNRCVEIALAADVFTRADSSLPCASWDAASEGYIPALVANLPAPGVELLPTPLIIPISNGFRLQYDLLGLTYWMLARQEEVGRTDLDEHERFPATASHAFRHGYLERPIVDEWLHILWQVIARTWPSLPLKKPVFTIKVSHDVDNPSTCAFLPWYKVPRKLLGDLLKRRSPRAFINNIRVKLATSHRLHPADSYNTFDKIMDISEQHGLRSAFYFICINTDTHDATYLPEDPRIRSLMRRINERGHEIGLHPGYGSFQTPELISAAADRLRRILKEEGLHQQELGGRMHYLRWEQPTTLRAWAAAEMTYDTTLSYADHAGFRCGTCFEYPAFDPLAKKSLPLRIRPLIAMECSIIDPSYMNLGTGKAAKAKFLQLKSACQAVNGCFTLLWHNSSFTSATEWSLYKAILAENSTNSPV